MQREEAVEIERGGGVAPSRRRPARCSARARVVGRRRRAARTMLRPSTAPRWKIATSTLPRRLGGPGGADQEARRRRQPRPGRRRRASGARVASRASSPLELRRAEDQRGQLGHVGVRRAAVVGAEPRDLRAAELGGQHGARAARWPRRGAARPAGARARRPAVPVGAGRRARPRPRARRARGPRSSASAKFIRASSAPGIHPRLGAGRDSRWAAAPRRGPRRSRRRRAPAPTAPRASARRADGAHRADDELRAAS